VPGPSDANSEPAAWDPLTSLTAPRPPAAGRLRPPLSLVRDVHHRQLVSQVPPLSRTRSALGRASRLPIRPAWHPSPPTRLALRSRPWGLDTAGLVRLEVELGPRHRSSRPAWRRHYHGLLAVARRARLAGEGLARPAAHLRRRFLARGHRASQTLACLSAYNKLHANLYTYSNLAAGRRHAPLDPSLGHPDRVAHLVGLSSDRPSPARLLPRVLLGWRKQQAIDCRPTSLDLDSLSGQRWDGHRSEDESRGEAVRPRLGGQLARSSRGRLVLLDPSALVRPRIPPPPPPPLPPTDSPIAGVGPMSPDAHSG
jgi:hypothetical protein